MPDRAALASKYGAGKVQPVLDRAAIAKKYGAGKSTVPGIPQGATIKPSPKDLTGFGYNLLSSGKEALSSTATALAPWNLPTTVGSVMRLGSGAFQKLIPGEQIDEPVFNAAVEHYKSEWSDPLDKLYRDPIGAGMDVATVLSPLAATRTLATRAPRIANIASKAVRVLDPINEVAIPGALSLGAEAVGGLGKAVVKEGRRYDPKKFYARAMQPTSNIPDSPERLAQLKKKSDIAFENRFTLGSEGSLQRLVAEEGEFGRQKRAMEQTNPNAPAWLSDIQATALEKANKDWSGRSGFWQEGLEGPEIGGVQRAIQKEVADLGAEPSIRQGMRSYGPTQPLLTTDLAPTPPSLGPPTARSSQPYVGPLPTNRQLPEPAIPMPPPSGPTQIAFDPNQVYEPNLNPSIDVTPESMGEILGLRMGPNYVQSVPRRINDATIQTNLTPQMSADIPPVPGRHLEGQVGRPEPIKPADRNLVESTRDMQTRGVLSQDEFTNEGYRLPDESAIPAPPLPKDVTEAQRLMAQNLAGRGITIDRSIIPEVPQGNVSFPTAEYSPLKSVRGRGQTTAQQLKSTGDIPTSQAQQALKDVESAIADEGFKSLPSEQQLSILRQQDQLRTQLATPGSEPYIPALAAETLKEGRYKDVGDKYGLPTKDVGATTITAKYIGEALKKQLESAWPGIKDINKSIGELELIKGDLASMVENTLYGMREAVPSQLSYGAAAGITGQTKKALPIGVGAMMKALMHAPQFKSRLAFWIYDNMHGKTTRRVRSAQELKAAFDAVPKAEIARIASRLEQMVEDMPPDQLPQ